MPGGQQQATRPQSIGLDAQHARAGTGPAGGVLEGRAVQRHQDVLDPAVVHPLEPAAGRARARARAVAAAFLFPRGHRLGRCGLDGHRQHLVEEFRVAATRILG